MTDKLKQDKILDYEHPIQVSPVSRELGISTTHVGRITDNKFSDSFVKFTVGKQTYYMKKSEEVLATYQHLFFKSSVSFIRGFRFVMKHTNIPVVRGSNYEKLQELKSEKVNNNSPPPDLKPN